MTQPDTNTSEDTEVIAALAAKEAKEFMQIYGRPNGKNSVSFTADKFEMFMAARCKQYVEYGYKLKQEPKLEDIKRSVQQGVTEALAKVLRKL